MIGLSVNAQGSLMKQADQKFEDFKYFEAIKLYKEYIDKKKKNAKEAYDKLAESYFRTSQYRQASYYFKKAIDSNKDQHDLKLKYAQALMSDKRYDEALKWFETYKETAPSDKRADYFINWCNNIDSYLADSSKYKINTLSFNSKSHDYSPAFYNGGLVFTSDRADRATSSAGQDGIYFDLFFVEHNFGTKWSEVDILSGKVQGKYNDGQAVFTEDGKTMYFSRNVKRSKNATNILKIYEAKWKNGKWADIKEMPFCSQEFEYSVSHPAISKNGKTMIFTSDRKGGKGGMDLYVVNKKGNKWSSPKNLGATVNSAGNEIFPTLHDDGTVYFSSNSWGGFGGLDIFSTKYENNAWQEATNVGYPINGSYDDSGLTLTPNKQIGYFASNRKGGKGFDDIYEIFIQQDKAAEMLVDKNLIEAPNPLKSAASANTYSPNKAEAEKKKQEEENQTIIADNEKEIDSNTASKNEQSTVTKSAITKKTNRKKEGKNKKTNTVETVAKTNDFNPKDEVNVFVPKEEDVAIGKVFYLIGSVLEYGKEGKEIKNAIVEVINHTDKTKQIHYADKNGNFYMPLTLEKEYTIVHTEKGTIQDFKQIDTKSVDSSELTHLVLRGKKPAELKAYVQKIYNRDIGEIDIIATQVVDRSPAIKTANTVVASRNTIVSSSKPITYNVPTTTNSYKNSTISTAVVSDDYIPTVSSFYGSDAVQNVTYKVQLGAFQRDVSTRSNFFKNVHDEIEKEIGPNSVKRYLTGFYTDYNMAKVKKEMMRDAGFNSAFVVVYINGVRQEGNTQVVLQELGVNF